jgi:hypothetical protein
MKLRVFEKLSHYEPIISVLLTLAIVLVISVLAANAQTQTLSVSPLGSGETVGRITSSPAAIDCPSTCSAAFNTNDMVTLTAAPATGSLAVFVEWTGACSGTTPTCDVTMDSAKTVGARFTQTNTYEKCVAENSSTWPLRFTLGASMTVGQCHTMCVQGGGTGYFLVSISVGTCLCATPTKPSSTGSDIPGGCPRTCPPPYSCGSIASRYSAYNTMAPPTAAGVSISGRVLSEIGRPIGKAAVTITDSAGNRRAALTSPFGYYKFEDVAAGSSYMVEVSSRGYEFEPRIVSVSDELTDVNFMALSLLFPQKE